MLVWHKLYAITNETDYNDDMMHMEKKWVNGVVMLKCFWMMIIDNDEQVIATLFILR